MGNPHTNAQNKYIKNKYDNIRLVVPKGRKEVIDAYAASQGISRNKLINDLLDERIGIWMPPADKED